MTTIALFYSRWPRDGLARPLDLRPLQQYRYAVWYKANPRGAPYMRALLQDRYSDAEWVDVQDEPGWAGRVSDADAVVLIYPDSIGLGFGPIERAVFARKRREATVHVLSGRRRSFRLDRSTRITLRLRRFLERTMLVEFLFVPIFVIVTPVLLVFDAMRERT
jgi:hypothetical protein